MGLDKVGLSEHLSLCGLCTWPLQSGGGFRGANEDVVLFLKKKKKLVYIFGCMSWILVAARAFL